MLVFRSIVVGLLGACVLLLAQRPITHIHVDASQPVVDAAAAAAPSPPSTTIIDVGMRRCLPSVSGGYPCFASDPLALLRLAADERVTAVGDVQVDDWSALKEALDRYTYRADGHYIELTITGGHGERRALLLLHGP
ncbi:MAG TPA: hypothetical protein VM513_07455 [Kofleriaceae bacterium]|nr:hypothetical protein [Enhygromyxa sp.]HVK83926.1 hypothetical protein [Kofleriaceae bacterium]